MKTKELAEVFSNRYHGAANKEVVLSIHLFGIEFSEALQGQNIKEICELANAPISYATEIRKGMRLSKYVELK